MSHTNVCLGLHKATIVQEACHRSEKRRPRLIPQTMEENDLLLRKLKNQREVVVLQMARGIANGHAGHQLAPHHTEIYVTCRETFESWLCRIAILIPRMVAECQKSLVQRDTITSDS
jgi:hypothetical protein